MFVQGMAGTAHTNSSTAAAGALAVPGVLAAVALYVWDDVLWAAPIAAAEHLLGAVAAFMLFTLVYGVGSYVVAILGVRAYDRRATRPSRLANALARSGEARRARFGDRLLRAGSATGFVLSSFALGGILTTWFLRYSGVRDGIERLAALSSAIFAVTFAGFYAGLFGLIT
jgi:hypothetical protein